MGDSSLAGQMAGAPDHRGLDQQRGRTLPLQRKGTQEDSRDKGRLPRDSWPVLEVTSWHCQHLPWGVRSRQPEQGARGCFTLLHASLQVSWGSSDVNLAAGIFPSSLLSLVNAKESRGRWAQSLKACP